MASFTEDGVAVTVTLVRTPSGDRVEIAATSLAGTVRLRSVMRDITDELSPAQLLTITNILNSAEGRARAYFEIT